MKLICWIAFWLILFVLAVLYAPILQKDVTALINVVGLLNVTDIGGASTDDAAFISYFNEAVSTVRYKQPLPDLPPNLKTSICQGCVNVVNFLRNGKQEAVQKVVLGLLTEICSQAQEAKVCAGLADTIVALAINVVFVDRLFSTKTMCPLIQACQDGYQKWSVEEWKTMVMSGYQNRSQPIPSMNKTWNLIHITDVHVDLLYQTGSSPTCSYPMCCRDGTGTAGYWGTSALCDPPLRTIDAMFSYMFQNLTFDAMIWTGDNIAHDVWMQFEFNETLPTQKTAELLNKYLVSYPNNKIYPALGNHEAYPCDLYDYYSDREVNIKKNLSEHFAPYLTEANQAMYRKYAYFAQVDTKHNIKMISLNSQAYDTMNWFLLQNPTDPDGMMVWLYNELLDCEKNSQVAMIFAHIPIGLPDCLLSWSMRYNILVERFGYLIRGQFFGHTHNDHFQVQRGVTYPENIVGVAHITPGMTTYGGLWPSIRVYQVDSDTNVMLNYVQYRVDLAASTPTNFVVTKVYDFMSEYGYSSKDNYMQPWMYDDLGTRVINDITTAGKFIYHFWTNSPTAAEQVKAITPLSRKKFGCGLKSGRYDQYYTCLGSPITDDLAYFWVYIVENLAGEWYVTSNSTLASKLGKTSS